MPLKVVFGQHECQQQSSCRGTNCTYLNVFIIKSTTVLAFINILFNWVNNSLYFTWLFLSLSKIIKTLVSNATLDWHFRLFQAMVTRFSSISTRKLSNALKILTSDKSMVAMSDYDDFHKLVKRNILTNILGPNAQVCAT